MAASPVRLSFDCVPYENRGLGDDSGKHLSGTIIRPSLEGKHLYHEDPIKPRPLQLDDPTYLSASMHDFSKEISMSDTSPYLYESPSVRLSFECISYENLVGAMNDQNVTSNLTGGNLNVSNISSNLGGTGVNLNVSNISSSSNVGGNVQNISSSKLGDSGVNHSSTVVKPIPKAKSSSKNRTRPRTSQPEERPFSETSASSVFIGDENRDSLFFSSSVPGCISSMPTCGPETRGKGGNRIPSFTQPQITIRHTAKITGFCKNSNEVWVYNIDVQGDNGPLSTYTIRRRFSDFKRLHRALSMNCPGENLPPLPDSGFISKLRLLVSDNTLYQRKLSFQNLLDAIAPNHSLNQHPAFLEFIGEAPASGSAGYVSLEEYGTPSVKLTTQITATHLRKRATSEPLRLQVLPTARRSNTLGE